MLTEGDQKSPSDSLLKRLSKPTNHLAATLSVATAEQIGVIEQVIKIESVHSLLNAIRQGPLKVVTLEKTARKTAEELGHGEIDLAISPPAGGID